MRYTGYLLFFLFLSIPFTHAQGLQGSMQVMKGSIKDTKGNPIAFSTVYVREALLGTAANQDGNFELSLPEGTYTCVFQSLGYQQVVKTVRLNNGMLPIHIVLPDMVYNLGEVVISGKKEDPAYRIIRHVIAKAPGYSRMIKSFQAEVYIRGSLHINTISKMVKWMAKKDLNESDIKEGDTYIEESVNEIDFTAPDLTRQKVKSIQSTFPDFGGDQSKSAIGFIAGNIYHPQAFGNAFSPIAPGSFDHYRFRYEGQTEYDGYSIHKIAILPLGSGPQFVKGTIYIVDGLWCVSNIDIVKEEQLGVTIYLTQNYNVVKEGAWLPVTNRLKVDVDLLGNSGSFSYHTSIRYHDLTVNVPGYRKPVINVTGTPDQKTKAFHEKNREQIQKKQQEIEKLATLTNPNTDESYRLARLQRKQEELKLKDSLRFNHEYVETYKTEFDSSARKNDTAFWNIIRPIPLTMNEMMSVKARDSLQVKAKPNDSANAPHKASWMSTLMFGGTFINDSLVTFGMKGIVNPFRLGYNTVDGFRYSTAWYWQKRLNHRDTLGIEPMLGYAFSRNSVYWDVPGYYQSVHKNTKAGFRLGRQIFDFNPDGVHQLETSVQTLVFRENTARFYKASYLNLHYKTDLAHDFSVHASLFLTDNRVMNNTSNFSLFFKDQKDFSPNVPYNARYRMMDHQDMSVQLILKYKSMPYYYIKDGIKVPRWRLNDTPEFSITWKKGLPVGFFDTDYDLIKLAIHQQKLIGLSDQFNYRFEAGYFPNHKNMLFTQFQHFAKRPLIAGIKEFFPYFLLMDPYRFSTDQYYAVAHLQYKSPFVLLKRLPVLRNRMWNESIFFSYLYTPQNKNYMEPGYGIGNMFYNLGVFTGLNGFNLREVGVRLSILIFGTKEITF